MLFVLSYFKTVSVGLVWCVNLLPPALQSGILQYSLTKHSSIIQLFIWVNKIFIVVLIL